MAFAGEICSQQASAIPRNNKRNRIKRHWLYGQDAEAECVKWLKSKDTAEDFKSLVSTSFTTRAGEERRVIIAFPRYQTLVLCSAIPQFFRNYRVGLAFLPSLSRL